MAGALAPGAPAGKQGDLVRDPKCRYREHLDIGTRVWTRGRAFPLSRLESRLRCPVCGSRDVVLLITIPRETQAAFATRRER